MKLIALLLLSASPLLAQSFDPKRGELTAESAMDKAQDSKEFQKDLGRATLALYVGKQTCDWKEEDSSFGPVNVWECEFKSKFICTATVVDRDDDEYFALTAGHCIEGKEDYYIGDTVEDKPVLRKVEVIKHESDDRYDYAFLTFHSFKSFPSIGMNEVEGDIPAIGTSILNVNFSLGLAKGFLDGKVVSEKLYGEGLKNRYLVSIGVGPGASGSAVVDAESHKIVGLVEMIAEGTQMPTIVIPTGKNLAAFLDDDSAGIKPLPPDESKLKKAALTPKIGFWTKLWLFIKHIFGY